MRETDFARFLNSFYIMLKLV